MKAVYQIILVGAAALFMACGPIASTPLTETTRSPQPTIDNSEHIGTGSKQIEIFHDDLRDVTCYLIVYNSNPALDCVEDSRPE